MTVISPYGQEIGVPYVMTGPDGSICTFNEPAGTNYVGPLSAVTGLDSPEVRESFGLNVERDGGFDNNYLLGRRPFTFQGEIVPTSVTDRLNKIAYLNAASLALQASGKLQWTTGAGKEVFLNFRRQQPVITSEAWVKKFFLSCVAADPRIYSKSSYEQYLAVNGAIAEDNIYKFTANSAESHSAAFMPITVEKEKLLLISQWIRVNSTWTGGAPKLEVTGIAGSQSMSVSFNLAKKGEWQLVVFSFTPSVSGTGNLVFQPQAMPTIGNFLEFNLPMIRSDDFTGTLGTAESLTVSPGGASWTRSNVFERPPYNAFHQGNYTAPTKITILGPLTGCKIVSTQTGEPLVQITVSIAKNERLVIDLDKRTATIEPSGADAYGKVNFLNTTWWGVLAAPTPNIGNELIKLTNVTGAESTTGAIVQWRDTWV